LVTTSEQFAQRVLRQQFLHLVRERRAGAREWIAGCPQRRRRLQNRIAQLGRHAGGDAFHPPGADQQIIGHLHLTLSRGELGGDGASPSMDRITPAIHPERPETHAVGNELAVEHVRRAARGHRYELRLHPCRWADHILDRHRFGRRRPGRDVHELRVRGAVVAHHHGGCHGVVALPPHRGPHRHHLAHDGLGRIPSARDDGLDVIDSDTTDHNPPRSLGAARSRVVLYGGPLGPRPVVRSRLQPHRALYPP
jgi:hypothetical protein